LIDLAGIGHRRPLDFTKSHKKAPPEIQGGASIVMKAY